MRPVVLAGGESSRMGREKALVTYNGKALIDYSLEVIAGLGEPLVVSNNEAVLDYLGAIEVIPDFLIGRGPLGGIHAAMEHTQDDVCIVACDTPLLAPEMVKRLMDEQDDNAIAVYTNEGKLFPFPGCYNRTLLADIERRLEGAGRDLSLQDMIRTTEKVAYIDIEDGVDTLVGINTPEDYRRITGHELD